MTREEAIARIKDHKVVHKMNEPRAIYISEALDMAINALEQELKTGHWIAHSDGGIWIKYYECSECGKVHDTHSDYCPNCGAKMESEDEEQIKVGTKVRTIKDKDFAGEEVFPVGTIGIVEEIREDEKLPYIIRANLDFWYYSRDMFEVIED